MNRLTCATRLAAALLGLGALAGASVAHADTRVQLSIGVPVAPVYAQPAPVYVQPAPVYVQPRPVYMQPRPVYVQPEPVYVQPYPVYGPQHRHWRGHPNQQAYRYGPNGDLDRDGVPNWRDRQPENRFRY